MLKYFFLIFLFAIIAEASRSANYRFTASGGACEINGSGGSLGCAQFTVRNVGSTPQTVCLDGGLVYNQGVFPGVSPFVYKHSKTPAISPCGFFVALPGATMVSLAGHGCCFRLSPGSSFVTEDAANTVMSRGKIWVQENEGAVQASATNGSIVPINGGKPF